MERAKEAETPDTTRGGERFGYREVERERNGEEMEERERVPYSTSSRSNGQVLTFYVGYWVMRREEGGRPTAPRPGRPPIGAFSIGVIFLSFGIFFNTLFSSFFSVSFRRHQKLTFRGGIFVLFLLCLWKESGSFSLFWSLSLLLFLFPLLWGSTGHGISLLASGWWLEDCILFARS